MKKNLICSLVCIMLAGMMLFSYTSCSVSTVVTGATDKSGNPSFSDTGNYSAPDTGNPVISNNITTPDGVNKPVPRVDLSIDASELSADYSRSTTEKGNVSKAFISAMAEFSMKMFRLSESETDKGKNGLISPLSAVVCLAMLANGADGNTKKQMEETFGMDIDTLNKSLYAYTESLYTSEVCKVNIADSIWFRDNDDSLHVKEEFLQENADWYNAQIYASPFDEGTVKDINSWVNNHTDGMIDNIIKDLSPNTMMMLINTLLFDSEWGNEYSPDDINKRTFTNYDNTTSLVDMMYSKERIWLTGDNYTGFTKYYKEGEYSFVGILPDDDIYDFIDSLTGEKWLQMWQYRNHTEVDVLIPEFSYDSDSNLNSVLKTMGMTDMFDQSSADFSKLGDYAGASLFCGGVAQKTRIEVTRRGTKAAAVTWETMGAVGIEEPPKPKEVYLDRPFIYMIVDNATGLPLFVGAVTSMK